MKPESKKPLVILVVIAVVALILYIGWSGAETPSTAGTENGGAPKTATQPSVTPPQNDILFFANDASKGLTPEQITQKKAEILKMVSGGKTLTADQKKTILSLIIGEQIKKYNFTDAERKLVIDALNKN